MKKLTADETNVVTLFLLVLWLILLVPWLFFAGLSAMAFDPGPSFAAYVFVLAILTYPVSVVIVLTFRKKLPLISLLPCANIAIWVIAGQKI